MKNKILVVEDSAIVTKVLRHVTKQELEGLETIFASTYAQAKEVFEKEQNNIYAALADLSLPDAPNGEVVDFLLQSKVPTVVLTGSYDDKKRESLINKGVVDYVIKETRFSYSFAVSLVNRLFRNQHIKVLVAEDSSSQRKFIVQRLHEHQFQTLEAENGVKALEVLQENPDIKLLITDYQMPEMDGFELVKTIRQRFEKSNLVIIGLSGQGEGPLSAKFIKNGANDFLQKPFCHEEFNCRIMHNIESLELIEKITHQANHDFLTDLPNRRYFFEQGDQLLAQARKNNTPLAAVVIDLDSFKAINDNYGHEAGDEILRMVGQQFKSRLSRFLSARTGGEEFCVLLPGLDNEKAVALINGFREELMGQIVEVSDDEVLRVTFSAGVTNLQGDTLDALLNQADEHLYRAKEAGRNMVIGDD
ncbi:MAG: diguanylate cyclase [Cellvibrionaceae bacterium]